MKIREFNLFWYCRQLYSPEECAHLEEDVEDTEDREDDDIQDIRQYTNVSTSHGILPCRC